MISDVLLPALRQKFPDRGLITADSPEPVAVFPAAHPEVGDVSISDGNEATVHIGKITHGHFGWEDPNRTERQIEDSVTENIVTFLTDLFADRVLLWKSPDNGSAGWRVLAYDSKYSFGPDALTYVWSGPIRNPEADAG